MNVDMLVASIVAVLLVAGSVFSLLAAIGVLRFPDLYTRMHAASKAGTIGSGLLLFAAGLYSLEFGVFLRAVAGFAFFVLTAPLSAHLLAKAAHATGHKLHDISTVDEMRRPKGGKAGHR